MNNSNRISELEIFKSYIEIVFLEPYSIRTVSNTIRLRKGLDISCEIRPKYNRQKL